MAEHCDKCGTELEPTQARHQRFLCEHAADSVDTMEGQLCSDCFWKFKSWLETESVE
jgi:methionyl-tRNA synthetase